MADYRLPMDADGVKYHGTVDQNEENPGQFMYGLDENGNKRIIRTDEQGNVLTKVTGSSTALEIIKGSTISLEPEQELVSDYFDNTSGNFSNFFINLYRSNQNNWQITAEVCLDKSGSWRSIVRREVLTPLEGTFQTLKGFDLAPYYIIFTIKNTGTSNSTFYNVIATFTR